MLPAHATALAPAPHAPTTVAAAPAAGAAPAAWLPRLPWHLPRLPELPWHRHPVPELGTAGAGSVIGHRGMRSTDHVGNRLEDFAAAADAGARWVELDVRRTADDQLVVVHDDRVDSHVPVVSAWIGGRAVGDIDTRDPGFDPALLPPRLDAVLDLLHDRHMGVDLHLKEHGYEGDVVAAVRHARMVDRSIFTSFDAATVRSVEQLDPNLRTGLLRWQAPLWGNVVDLTRPDAAVRAARSAGADMLVVNDRGATPRTLRAASAAALPVVVWTVDDTARAAALLHDPNVLAVITDAPGAMLGTRPAPVDPTPLPTQGSDAVVAPPAAT